MKHHPKELLPCPFCGGALYDDAYDRGIGLGCDSCGYQRRFKGLIQPTPHHEGQECIPIIGEGGRRLEPSEVPVESREYYHHDAHEVAWAEMNRRADATAIQV